MNDAADREQSSSRCPSCGVPFEPGDQFCEGCGTSLSGDTPPVTAHGAPQPAEAGGLPVAAAAPPSGSIATAPVPLAGHRPCVGCRAPAAAIDADGYCTECGLHQPGPRDHQELDLGMAAGVSDRGRHHQRNEDAFHLARTACGAVVTVVCDGVSSSVHPEVASQAAADAAGAVLAAATDPGLGPLVDATIDGMGAAQQAVAAIPWTDDGSRLASPSCTLVSAACRDGAVAVGWVGDSRAYWIGGHGVRQLTVDNSWAEAEVESGRMTELEADGDPRSHAITRWLGADAPDGDPQVTTVEPDGPGRLLVCSDGLWNYAPTAGQMTDVVASHSSGATPIEAARALTDFALAAGGHDNITVVIIDIDPGPSGPESEGQKGMA